MIVASLAHIAAGFALSLTLGFGAAYWLLPGAYRRYALLVAPAAGYALFCLAAITISVNFRLPANTAVWIALALLGMVALSALLVALRRAELHGMWDEARPAALAATLMVAVMFWPVLYQGTALYIGTANIDFYQSLAYQEVLARFGIGALDPRPAFDYSFDPFFGSFPDPIPAKFGGVMFGLLLQKLLGVEPRTALMAALVAFLLALPAATSLFARIALGMDRRAAVLSAFLIAMSAPVAMSFIHVLVGQNSSLALLPLGLATCALAIRTRDWRAMTLAALLLAALFWMYVAMLPYVAAPVGLYALYDLARNRKGALRWLFVAVGVLAVVLVALHVGMAKEARQLLDDMVALLGRANRVVYVDFLTELSLPHSLGLSSYPVTASAWLAGVSPTRYLFWAAVFVAAAMVALVFWWRWFAAWARRAAPEARAFGLAVAGVYLAVWLYFNFVSLYGYAIFKMASWLQFFFVPIVAYALTAFIGERRAAGGVGRVEGLAGAGVATILVAANAVATLDYGVKGLGDDTRRGSIVNSYGIGGNPDYPALETALARALPQGTVVGIAMPDYIANLWTAYYVRRAGVNASLVSHDDFPDEDAVLPDIVTGKVVNSANQELVYKPRYHAERPPFLLLEGPASVNREIIDQKPEAPALWSNGSFVLADTGRVHDALVTARGFYRLEYFDALRYPYWWPDRMRWSAQGGEFLLLNASRPAEPHRLSLLVVAGTERERPRHVEVWVNGRKVDEIEVRGAARIVSAPFQPTGGFDKIVVKVRERVERTPRNFGLWNRHIAIDQRLLNVIVTQARVLRGEDELPRAGRRSLSSRDLVDATREFNGVSLDGWAAPSARLVLPLQPGASRARLRIEVPAWAGYRFPLRIEAEVNGRRDAHEIAGPGAQTLDWRVDPGAQELAVRLESGQSTAVPGAGNATFRIESLSIE